MNLEKLRNKHAELTLSRSSSGTIQLAVRLPEIGRIEMEIGAKEYADLMFGVADCPAKIARAISAADPLILADTAEPRAKPKPDRLPTTPAAKRIASIMGRKLTTPWSEREIRAYKSIGAIPEDDLKIMEEYYLSGCPYLRKDLSTLLNNWPGELDRAWAHAQEKQPVHRALIETPDPVGWREFLAKENQPYAPWQNGKGYLKDRFREQSK